MGARYDELREYIQSLRVVSTHCHHMPDSFFQDGFDLARLLNKSYAAWCGVALGEDRASRARFFDAVRFRSYFRWIERALQSLYSIDAPLNADTFVEYDRAVREAHLAEPARHLGLLAGACRYERVVLDSYWSPGDANGHPALFAPTFRADSFYFAYDREACDHDGMNAIELFGIQADSLESVLDSLHAAAAQKKAAGAVAFKCAMPYSRGLDFAFASKADARKVFHGSREDADIKAYQDYLFHALCEMAEAFDLPLQIHTGLGRLERSNAHQLRPSIAAHKNTRFVLFHGGYPWMDDVLGLVHVFPENVFPDLCWLPIISQDAAARMLSELLEVCDWRSICWGCDAWTSEESYGALLAAEHVVASVLDAKVQCAAMDMADARDVASAIFRDNAKQIYRL